MKIFITGATGFIGMHTALALLEAGHQVRLLVRDEQKAKRIFSAHGWQLDDFIVADMRDELAVKQGMDSCDVVIHAAALVSLDPKKAEEIGQSNLAGTKNIIGTACEKNIKNIIYVSSLGALFRPNAGVINQSSELGIPTEPYSVSKKHCEEYVRQLQEQGHPIQISYPGGVFGPDDPGLSESNHALITFLTGVIPITSSGIQCVDVRDVAALHRYLVLHPRAEGEPQQYRYIVGGNFYPWKDFHAMLEKITGRKILAFKTPAPVLRFFGKVGDFVKKIYPIDLPLTSESMAIVTQWTFADSSHALSAAGFEFRSGEETFSDTTRWLVKAGYLKQKFAGKL